MKLNLNKHFLPCYTTLAKLFITTMNGTTDKTLKNVSLKAAKGVGKTVSVCRLMTLGMILDPRASWLVFMSTATFAVENLIPEFEKAAKHWDRYFPGTFAKWEFSKGQNNYGITFNGQFKQEIKFSAMDKMHQGGWGASDPNCYMSGYFIEEAQSAKDRNNLDFEKFEEFLTYLPTINSSLNRHLRNLKLQGIKVIPNLINFMNQNPWNGEHPFLRKHNKALPDDLEAIDKYGYIDKFEEDTGDYYFTSSYMVNPFFFNDVNEMKTLESFKALGTEIYNTVAKGINGYPQDLPLSGVWSNQIIPMQKKVNEYNRYKDFEPISFGLDISEGKANQALILIGAYDKPLDNTNIEDSYFYSPLKEWVLNPNARQFNADLWAAQVCKDIIAAFTEFPRLNDVTDIPLFVDGSADSEKENFAIPYFKALETQKQIAINRWYAEEVTDCPLNNVKFQLFPQSQKVKWTTATRMLEWLIMLSTKRFVPFREWTPTLYREIPVQQAKPNGSRIDGGSGVGDDCLTACEYGMFSEFKYVVSETNIKIQ